MVFPVVENAEDVMGWACGASLELSVDGLGVTAETPENCTSSDVPGASTPMASTPENDCAI